MNTLEGYTNSQDDSIYGEDGVLLLDDRGKRLSIVEEGCTPS